MSAGGARIGRTWSLAAVLAAALVAASSALPAGGVYLVAFAVMQALAPRLAPAALDEADARTVE